MPASNLIWVIFWELIPGRNLEMSYTFSLVVSGSYLNDNTGVFFFFLVFPMIIIAPETHSHKHKLLQSDLLQLPDRSWKT